MTPSSRRAAGAPAALFPLLLSLSVGAALPFLPGLSSLTGRGAVGWIPALAAGLAASAAGRALGALAPSGAAAALVLAALMARASGWPGLILLLLFVASASSATRFRRRHKAALDGAAPEGAGRRTGRQALANGGAALLFALAGQPAAMAGCLAAALSDTLSSELGMAGGGRTVMITSLRPVTPGADGAVSVMGSAAGLAAAALMAAAAWGLGTVTPIGAACVAAGGIAGNATDSLLGATLERRGRLDNDTVNYLATLTGGLTTLTLTWILGTPAT